MTASQFSFFCRYLRELAESLFIHHLIDSQQCSELMALGREPEGRECARQLFSRQTAFVQRYKLRLRLKHLREIDGAEFPHIEVLPTRQRSRKVCFVGHRFIPGVEKTLRWNLAQLLEPYNVHVDWSGKDPRSVQIFDDIVRRIKRANFCIFDNRATDRRPNVYIEVGVAYAFRVPFILFEYVPQKPGSRRPSIPTDLSHALTLRYENYQELFRGLYFALPAFFKNNL